MPVASIVVDPPHRGASHYNDVGDGIRPWKPDEMAQLMADQLDFYHKLVPPCHQMVQDGPMWVHLPIHNVWAFQSVAYWDRWQAQRSWGLSAEEVLLCLYQGARIAAPMHTHVWEHKHLNQWNAPKSPAWVKALLAVSPDGPVFDPMVGTGSTLVAALEMGRFAVGIELQEDLCRQAVGRIEALAA
jgi:hypothetical protein